MSSILGIIGGSGVYKFEDIKIIREITIETPFGTPSDAVLELEYQNNKFFFLARHGRDHRFLPSEVNYQANIFALKSLGVKHLLSISAVGSLDNDCPPSSFVIPDQFIDWTKGLRARTFFGKGVIGHVSTANPVDPNFSKLLMSHVQKHKIQSMYGGSYICIEGPQFSSKAESMIYRSFGARVIGMTNVPEAYLAKEAGMAYATMAMVTDFDCWKEEHCNVEEIMKIMKGNYLNAQKVVQSLVVDFYKNIPSFKPENAIGVMTPKEAIPASFKQILEVLLK